MATNNCRICGLYFEAPPWGEDGHSPTFDICPCCGVEFGNEDYTFESAKRYRAKWIDGGASWFMPKKKPSNWDIQEQMLKIPPNWR